MAKNIGSDPVAMGKLAAGLNKTVAERTCAALDKGKYTFLNELDAFLKMSAKTRTGIFKTAFELPTETTHLRLISGDTRIVVSVCDNSEKKVFTYQKKAFSRRLNSSFKDWKRDIARPVIDETSAAVYELIKDGSLEDLFGSFDTALENIAWESQEQVEKFCKEYPTWLRTAGYGTLFLTKEIVDHKEGFLVSLVVVVVGLNFDENAFRNNLVIMNASRRHRIVVPQRSL